ncbi:DUF3263 domain-containing protein [Yimella sp. cx-573]|nr:DUF3263 domain-containing protein [Yimella sp. cx-573]
MDFTIIELERHWLHRPQHDGRKANQIRERTGLTETQYYQALNRLLQDPGAWRLDATTMAAVQRRVERGARQRGS